jgi:alkanesulfonate monooxygenase SsuD/methylene tetrahydromethanopterin reductase-like flavin-dependent oxidoreductase (luciferase family)
VKFHWFAEVTYPHLPPDFAEKHASSWVDVPRSLYNPAEGQKVYEAFLNEYEYADKMGFDSIAVNEHHQYAGAMTPSPNLFASILARNTKQAAILIIGDSIAMYNPPVRVAEEMAMIDVISGGRVIAGLVLGTPMDSAFCYGIPPTQIRDRWHEAHDLILKAWSSPEPFSFNGKYTKLRNVNIWPQPIQQPRPPIWVPGGGSVETWELTNENNYCYGHLSFSGLQKAKPVVDGYWDFVDQAGGDMNPHRFAFTQIVCVSETDAQAEKDYKEAVEYFYRFAQRVPRQFAAAPGYQTPRSMAHAAELAKRGASVNERGAAGGDSLQKARTGQLTFKEFVDDGFVIAGSPATVVDKIRELATTLRIGQLITMLQIGNMNEEQTNKNTHLFATEVMPHLRDLFSEYEDNWTPAVTQKAAAPVA